MDPDARVQAATLGTSLHFKQIPDTSSGPFIGQGGSYASKESLESQLATYTRVYGLASTPDFGGQPNTIDTTTLDNTKAETSVLGLQPAAEVTYEINMMTFNDNNGYAHNLRAVKALADEHKKAHWVVYKASGVIIEYDAYTHISYTADAQQDVEKFSIYHDIRSDITVSLPATSASN